MFFRNNVHAPANLRRAMSGFTVIELLSTLSVLAVLLLVALPSVRSFLLDSRRAANVNDLVGSLNFGRMQAILSRTPITVCRSLNPLDPAASCAGSGGWESGWIVFIDQDGNGVRDEGDIVLRRQAALPNDSTLRGNSKVGARVTFKTAGITSNNGSFALCDPRGWGGTARVIVVATSGRVRTTNPAQPVDNPLSSCTPSA